MLLRAVCSEGCVPRARKGFSFYVSAVSCFLAPEKSREGKGRQ